MGMAMANNDGDVVTLFRVLDAVRVVVGRELELRGILIALVGMGVVDDDFAFLPFQAIIGHIVVPGNILLVNELALLAFSPNSALRLVDTDDVHIVGKL